MARTLVLALLLALLPGCGGNRAVGRADSPVLQIPLRLSNAYLVLGRRPILVDTGSPSPADAQHIDRVLAQRGLQPTDLALVVLTHAHPDHAGGAARLAALGVPVLAGGGDLPMLRAGYSPPPPPNGLEARLLRPFVDPRFAPLEPTYLVDRRGAPSFDLTPFGVDGHVEPTPGHTAGSLTVLLDSGEAIAGDVLRGGYLGGFVRPDQPLPHYFHDDGARAVANLRYLLARGVTRFYIGHGGPLTAASVRRQFGLSRSRSARR